MNTISLLKDADELIARAQAVATVLAEKGERLGVRPDVEALLRVGIEAARLDINRYAAVVALLKKSRLTMGYIAEAKARCNRNIQQLRRRVTRATSELSRLMNQKEGRKSARYIATSG
jgi:hypothetical protein